MGAAVDCVRALASLDFDKLAQDRHALGDGKAGDGVALGFDPQAALAMRGGRYPDVADNLSRGARSRPLSNHYTLHWCLCRPVPASGLVQEQSNRFAVANK